MIEQKNRKLIKFVFNIDKFNLDEVNIPPDLENVINNYIPKSLNLYKFFYIDMGNKSYDDDDNHYIKKYLKKYKYFDKYSYIFVSVNYDDAIGLVVDPLLMKVLELSIDFSITLKNMEYVLFNK